MMNIQFMVLTGLCQNLPACVTLFNNHSRMSNSVQIKFWDPGVDPGAGKGRCTKGEALILLLVN